MNGLPAQDRRSARVIVVDERGRVLLIRVSDPRDVRPPSWITPGGGLEPGEELVDAAVRELREETGLVVTPEELGSPVATCRGEWVFRGTRYRSHDVFFAVTTSAFELDESGWTDLEREVHAAWRWCETGDLESLDGEVVPAGLADVVASIVSGQRPDTPLELPWRTL